MINLEDRHMDYSGELLEKVREGAPNVQVHEQQSGIRNVQNLEAFVLPCWRKILMIRWMCSWSI